MLVSCVFFQEYTEYTDLLCTFIFSFEIRQASGKEPCILLDCLDDPYYKDDAIVSHSAFLCHRNTASRAESSTGAFMEEVQR